MIYKNMFLVSYIMVFPDMKYKIMPYLNKLNLQRFTT